MIDKNLVVSEETEVVQRRLNSLGYATISVDGKYGSATAVAVKSFQKNNALTVDGIVGLNTWDQMFSFDAIKKDGSAAVDLPCVPYGEKILRVSREAILDVKFVQHRLKALGYTVVGTVDGVFGAKTQQAVTSFQKKNALRVDGIVGSSTWGALFAQNAETNEAPVAAVVVDEEELPDTTEDTVTSNELDSEVTTSGGTTSTYDYNPAAGRNTAYDSDEEEVDEDSGLALAQSLVENEEDADLPAPDIIRCTIDTREVYLGMAVSAKINCNMKAQGFVSAWVVKGEYTPPAEPDSAAVQKVLAYNKKVDSKTVSFVWDAYDQYDQRAEAGDYVMVVRAKVNANAANADVSFMKFAVKDGLPVDEADLHGAAEEVVIDLAAGERVPSKCEGVDYPVDIDGHWAKDLVKAAYDLCFVQGGEDGKFRPDVFVTRAEAVKLVISAAEIETVDCEKVACDEPFVDLEDGMKPWIRTAYEKKIIGGTEGSAFGGGKIMTRAEASALLAKAFSFAPFKGCYTTNCGAGHPDAFFTDIRAAWQGPWLRALWDRGLIRGVAPGRFEPDRGVTRAELVKMVMKARE